MWRALETGPPQSLAPACLALPQNVTAPAQVLSIPLPLPHNVEDGVPCSGVLEGAVQLVQRAGRERVKVVETGH